MIYFTQLIYLQPGKEAIFEQFEGVAMPLIEKYNGKLLLRMKPSEDTFIESAIEQPYEVHLVCFETEDDFEKFKNDEERNKFLHLKNESVRNIILIKGTSAG